MTNPATPASRRKMWAVVLAYTALLCAVWADPLLTRRNFTGRDLLAYNLPMEKTIHDAYARGRWPLWSPDISGGRPLLPNPNAGALYPVRILFGRLSFPLAMRLFPILHWLAGGIGVIFLVASLGGSASACFVGAVTYAFSGVVVSEVFFPHILPGMALLPWILWRLHAAGPSWRRTLGLAGFLALDALAADVFTIAIALVAGALWVLREELPEHQWRRMAEFAVATALALLVAAPQIVATALWIPQTNRGVLGMKLSEATLFSASPFRLVEFFVPYPFGATWMLETSQVWGWRLFGFKAMGLFVTMYAGALAPLAWWRLRGHSGPGLAFSRWFVGLSLLVAMVPSLIPRAWRSLPSPLPLRNPEKVAVMASLGLALIAAAGLDDFRRSSRMGRWTIVFGGGFAAAATMAWLWPAPAARVALTLIGGDQKFAGLAARLIPSSLAEGGLLWMLTIVALDLWMVRPRLALVSLLILTAVPVLTTRRIAEVVPQEAAFAPSSLALRLKRADPHGSYRTLGESIYFPGSPVRQGDLGWREMPGRNWTQHTQALWNRGTVFNYDFDAGDLARIESLRRISAAAGVSPNGSAFFGALSLRWGIRFREQPPVAGYHRVGGDILQDWDEHERAYPDIRLVTRWKEDPDSLTALKDLSLLGPGEVVLETGRSAAGTAPVGRIRMFEKSPGRIRLETTVAQPTWLFVLRAFWTYRSVRIDGREVECRPAELAFSAVPVPAGVHLVEWREELPGAGFSRWGPLAALAIGLAIALSRQGRERT